MGVKLDDKGRVIEYSFLNRVRKFTYDDELQTITRKEWIGGTLQWIFIVIDHKNKITKLVNRGSGEEDITSYERWKEYPESVKKNNL